MRKEKILEILENAKDGNGAVPMRLVRTAFDKLPEPCEDTISRQAAIDAIDEERKQRHLFNTAEDGLLEARRIINTLTPVQPEVLACGNGELVAQPEPTDIDAKEAVYNLAEKIGIHQLFALTVELRGEPIQPELTYEQVEEYCKKRCLHVVTDDFFESTKPQRLGHWILYDKRFPWRTWYKCSECGNYLDFSGVNGGRGEANYCPNCGAKMSNQNKIKGERQK